MDALRLTITLQLKMSLRRLNGIVMVTIRLVLNKKIAGRKTGYRTRITGNACTIHGIRILISNHLKINKII
jgi:hypothetical protein